MYLSLLRFPQRLPCSRWFDTVIHRVTQEVQQGLRHFFQHGFVELNVLTLEHEFDRFRTLPGRHAHGAMQTRR
jgi:hypothetical protein